MATPIIVDGTMDRVASAPRVFLPEAGVFSERAARFAQLAPGHAMADYLLLMSAIAAAQDDALARRSAPPVAAVDLDRSREYGMPPLSALGHARDPQWRDDLRDITRHVARVNTAPAVQGAIKALANVDAKSLEALADRVLGANTRDDDAVFVPFVGAALQVCFTRLAATLAAADLERFDVPTVCPVCATRPVASVVRLGGARSNLRYLVCALCATEWNLARIQCTACEEHKGVHYLTLQAEGDTAASGPLAARKAEACDECKSYLKIFYQEKDPLVDPVADDIASLALDLLVDEQGFGRSGPNLLLHPGGG